jgi:predicted nucleic acid-binding protein
MEARLIDTNVFIDIFRGNETFHWQLQLIRGHINDVIYIELIQGGRLNKSELREIKNYLRPLSRIHISQRISITAVTLVEQYGASHGLMLADALIASTALVWGLPLVTLNEKDFQFIQGLQISGIG